jgi:hypothetical protein
VVCHPPIVPQPQTHPFNWPELERLGGKLSTIGVRDLECRPCPGHENSQIIRNVLDTWPARSADKTMSYDYRLGNRDRNYRHLAVYIGKSNVIP